MSSSNPNTGPKASATANSDLDPSTMPTFVRLVETMDEKEAKAVDAHVRAVVDQQLRSTRNEVVKLKKDFIALRDAHNAQPPAARGETQAAVVAARDEVRRADDNQDALEAKAEQGPVTEAEVEAQAQQVKQTQGVVTQLSDVLERRLSAVENATREHAAILAPRAGSTNDNRLEDIEGDITALRASLDQVATRSNEAYTIATRVRQTVTSGGPLRRAGTWALITFGVVFVLYWLVFALTPLDWTLRGQFAWPFGLAAVAFWIVLVFSKGAQSEETITETEEHRTANASTSNQTPAPAPSTAPAERPVQDPATRVQAGASAR